MGYIILKVAINSMAAMIEIMIDYIDF